MVRLSDCFTNIFAYGRLFFEEAAYRGGNYDEFRNRIVMLLDESKEQSEKQGFSGEDYELALFAVVTWLDELVMCSGWAEADQWKKEQLQRSYFNTARAGEEFFKWLDSLTPDKDNVREVFLVCLILGLKGKYYLRAERDVPGELVQAHFEEFLNAKSTGDAETDISAHAGSTAISAMQGGKKGFESLKLLPAGYQDSGQEDSDPNRFKRFSRTEIIMFLAPAALLLILYIVYDIELYTQINEFLQALE